MFRRGTFLEKLFIEVEGRHRRHGVQTGVKAGHGRRDDRCSNNTHQARKSNRRNEIQYDQIFIIKRFATVVAIEQDAQPKEQDKYQERDVAHHDIGLFGVADGLRC